MIQDIIQGRRTDQVTIKLPLEIKNQEEKPATASKDQPNQEPVVKREEVNVSDSSSREVTPDRWRDMNKKNFFNSNSDESTYSWNGNILEKEEESEIEENGKEINEEEEDETETKEYQTDINGDKEKKDEKEMKDEEKIDEEDKELEKLLRMTDINPNTRPSSAGSGENKTEKDEKDKKDPKSKEVSLSDCLEVENEDKSTIINQEDQVDENEKKSENEFFLMLNSQIKKSFLLSSDENLSSDEETECEVKKKRQKRRSNKKVKKRKKDDLSEYRIPSLSGESSGESPKPIEDELKSEENTDEDSDESVQCVEFVEKRKKKIKTEKGDSSSSSDAEKICSKPAKSPPRGRKNIQKILRKENLQVETKQAVKMEAERKKRVSERQKLYELLPGAKSSSRLVLDFDPETKDELVVVEDSLARQLKPHQKEGVRFMWNCCFESLKRLEEDSGSGCILAHCMGLGKTLQVITLVQTILTHNTGVQTVLILCPLNTIRNWMNEFKIWLQNCSGKVNPIDLTPCKSTYSRILAVKTWGRNGGVLITNYDMFRSMIKADQRNAVTREFLDPGPDLVICDEGHLLKNSSSNLSKCLNQIKTLRRIILTGTPLQNNLIEYYCMVQFVKPNILGTKKEFCNRFVNPINNGQFEDSTELDVKIMKRRSHVLHTMLEGFIQRYGYYVLMPFLPEKHEYVISIALTERQENIYRSYIEEYNRCSKELLKDYHWLQKVWTHPWVMTKYMEKHNVREDMRMRCGGYLQAEDYGRLESSGKLVLLFDILRLCKRVGDKVLVFSQSLLSLDLIEYFLKKANYEFAVGITSEYADSWANGLDYFRLDGSTTSETRDGYCQKFNNVENERLRLLLVSTKAGGLGINLVAANRVVVFDVSWNPTHDVQSIFRVYRFGQNKPCFIYRFLAAATMEEKIYRRQVTKLSLAHRILDEHQIERHYTMGNLQELYTYDPIPRCQRKILKIPKDSIFAEVLTKHRDIIVGYHEHDSLLENKEEEVLTEEERKAAWDDYEKEKLLQKVPQFNGWAPPTPPVMKTGEKSVMPQRILLPVRNQMCKIVNVRTLHGMNGTPDRNRLLEIGESFGLKPFKEESLEKYCWRINETLQVIFPGENPISEEINLSSNELRVDKITAIPASTDMIFKNGNFL